MPLKTPTVEDIPVILGTMEKMMQDIISGELKARVIDGEFCVKPADALRWAINNGIKPPPELIRGVMKHGGFDPKD